MKKMNLIIIILIATLTIACTEKITVDDTLANASTIVDNENNEDDTLNNSGIIAEPKNSNEDNIDMSEVTPNEANYSYANKPFVLDALNHLDELYLVYNIVDENETAIYRYYEYETTSDLDFINNWLLDELIRHDAYIIGKTLDINKENTLRNVKAEILNNTEYTHINYFNPKYGDAQRLIFIETNYKRKPVPKLNESPLIVYLPLSDGTIREIFIGSFVYYTETYAAYYETKRFLKEINQSENSIKLNGDISFEVGWFNKDGEIIGEYDLSEEIIDNSSFGVRFNSGVLPKDEIYKEHFLKSLALTLLTGNKSQWWDIPFEKSISFLEGEKLIQTYSLGELSFCVH